jgi:hypothetical protein
MDYGNCHDHSKQHCQSRLDGFPARHHSRKGMSKHHFTRDLSRAEFWLRAQSAPAPNISVYVWRSGGGKSGLIPNSVRITPNGEVQIALDNARLPGALTSQAAALLENAKPGLQMFGAVR